jgi:hypothetical protein
MRSFLSSDTKERRLCALLWCRQFVIQSEKEAHPIGIIVISPFLENVEFGESRRYDKRIKGE